jgi:hypothetical protein
MAAGAKLSGMSAVGALHIVDGLRMPCLPARRIDERTNRVPAR